MIKSAVKKIGCTAIAIVLTVITLSPAASAFEKDFTADFSQYVYNSSNGLPDNSIEDMLMTSDGIMWFASSSGLIKYDGKQFSLINRLSDSSFQAMTAKKLFEDSLGRLWIGTSDGGIICHQDNTYITIGVANGATSDSVGDIIEQPNGDIVAVTANGLFSVDRNFNVILPQAEEAKKVQAISAASDASGRILGISGNDELFLYHNGVYTNYGECIESGKCDLTYIITDKDGIFNIGSSNGKIFKISFNESGFINYTSAETNLGSINHLSYDNDGNMWISAESGTGFFDANGVFHRADNLKTSGHITSVCNDYQGDYWFSSDTYGVEKLCKSVVSNFNNAYSLGNFLVNCVQKINGNTYIGTDQGLTIVNEQTGAVLNDNLNKALFGLSVTDIMQAKDGCLWIGTGSDGLFKQRPDGSVQKYTKAGNNLVSDRIKRLFQSQNGDIVIGTAEGMSVIRNENIYYTLSKSNGFTGSAISFYESDDALYVGTEDNGAYAVFGGGKITSYTDSDGIESGRISKIVKVNSADGIWVAAGTKLMYVNTKGSKEIDSLNISKPIIDLLTAPDGKLWIITANNIIIAGEKELLDGDTTNVKRISSGQGLVSNISIGSHSLMSDDGILYICCDNGVYTINTANYSINNIAPKILINKIATENDEIEAADKITVSDKASNLTFNISILSYHPAEKYMVQYYMDGMDKAPTVIPADSANVISYSNIAGGNYTFNICTIDENGAQVGESVTIKVEKEMSIYEKASFKASAFTFGFLAFIVLMYVFIFLKARQAEKKRKQYMAITLQAVMSITKAIDAKDPYTKGHSERVARYSAEVARRLKFKSNRVESLYYTALLHDIGKIGIPDNILKKPESLTPEEYEVMKTHTTIGAEILSGITAIKNIRYGALEHHEKYNGKGYPQGLKGNKISLEGRIIGAADAYDAMASNREYSDAYEADKIISEIETQSGEQFDPRIAAVIIDMIKDGYFDDSKEP